MKNLICAFGLAALTSFVSISAEASVPCVAGDYDLLPKALSGYTSHNMQSVKIDIEVPNRSQVIRCTVSPLEYGDLISFSFAEGSEAVATISVDQPLGFGSVERKIKLRFLALHPTIIGDERAIYPYFIRIKDQQSRLTYDLYLNRSGKVAKTKVYQLQ